MTDAPLKDIAEQARRAISANPRDDSAHRRLGAALRRLGDEKSAHEAEMAAVDASQYDPRIRRAGSALLSDNIAAAEAILSDVIARDPDNFTAIRMRADVMLRSGRPAEAEALSRRALELAPGFEFARYTLATALHLQNRSGEAYEELERLEQEPHDEIRSLRAAVCSRIGRYDEAADLYGGLASRYPDRPELWISLANVHKIGGERDGAVAAYRRVLEIIPYHGEAWWSLANLKTFRFSDEEIAALRAAIARPGLRDDDLLRLNFALGKALEDRGEDEAAFAAYAEANRLRARQLGHEPAMVTALVESIERTLMPELMQARPDAGFDARDPIFILGMPRAGSTLVEQILASHSMIEGTAELPDIILIARDLEQAEGTMSTKGWVRYPGVLTDLAPPELRRLGELYIERTRIQRQTDRPLFTDKMPNNWIHTGLIRLILPNARIIDVRRHPLACGFSNFKQHFARGQEFSYDLGHFGQYYRDYVRLMRHFDAVDPGGVHRLIYEDLVADPEAEIRRMLDYLDVPFEAACLNFHETKRPIRTASSEQVRKPISADSAELWKRFDKWLDPLRNGLGPALENWRS